MLNNNNGKNNGYMGDNFFSDAAFAAPIAAAITNRIFAKKQLKNSGKNIEKTYQADIENNSLAKKESKMKKINIVFLILIPLMVMVEIAAFANGSASFSTDAGYFLVIFIGYFYTKNECKKYKRMK